MKTKNKADLFIKLTITALIISGLVAFVETKNLLLPFSKNLSQATEQVAIPTPIPAPIPNHIRIPSVAIDIDVKEATVSANDWGLFKDAASYLKTSGALGRNGNAVFYAHNKKVLFGGLAFANVGDRIFIDTDKGEEHYVITETKIVSPDQIDIVYPTSDERLTLFTCTNFLDADRFVVVAKPAATFGELLDGPAI